METGEWVPILLAFLVMAASPGPANIATATVAMRFGRLRSLWFGLGLSLGLAVWGLVAATGMGAILQGSAHLLFVLKIAGGLYLLWLAVQSGRSALRGTGSEIRTAGEGRWFLRGLLLNLSNPKAVVAWMAALAMGLDAGAGSGRVAAVTGLCIAIGVANYTLYALVFSLPGVMAGYRRICRWVDAVVAGLFTIAGLGLIRSAFSR
ncbi:MAG: LysE family translocator [Pseudomonadota bacterium]